MVAAGKKLFLGLVGLGVFGMVGKAVYAGASSGDLFAAGVAGLALAVAAYFVSDVIPD